MFAIELNRSFLNTGENKIAVNNSNTVNKENK